jgi:hypothetical protein
MKDIWYADKRDILKWSGLVHLCSKEKIGSILWVPYYRKQEWPELIFDKANISPPEQVIKHFRDIEDIARLAQSTGLVIEVIRREFSHDTRTSYHRDVCEKIRRINEQKIVFLDPDVGLAPTMVKAEHVRRSDITEVWRLLNPRDFLVFYQHRFRTRDWVERRRNQLAEACGVEANQVKAWSASQASKDVVMAKDAVFFFIEKQADQVP